MRTKYSSPVLYELYTNMTDIERMSIPLVFLVTALLFIMQTKLYLLLITIPIMFCILVLVPTYTTITHIILTDSKVKFNYGGNRFYWYKINFQDINSMSKTKIDDIPYYNEVYKYEICYYDHTFNVVLKENDFDYNIKKMIVSKELS